MLTGHKLIVVVCDNGGFAVHRPAAERQGRRRPSTTASPTAGSSSSVAGRLRRSTPNRWARIAETVQSIGELEQALRRAPRRPTAPRSSSIKVQPHQWTPGDAWWDVGVPEVSAREGSAQGDGRSARRARPSSGWASDAGQGRPPRRRADRLVEQRPAAARRRHAARDLPRARAAQAGFSGTETGVKFPMDAGVLGPILQKHELKLVSGWFSGELLEALGRGGDERHAAADGRPSRRSAPRCSSMPRPPARCRTSIDGAARQRPRLADERLPRLWPQAHRSWPSMDGRFRRADDLSPSHGHGRRDRARDRPADGQHRRGGRACSSTPATSPLPAATSLR